MTTSVQNHIHLSLEISEDSEHSPNIQWAIRAGSRREIPRVFIALDESLSGHLQTHVLTDDNGIVRRTDIKAQIVLSAVGEQSVWDRKDALINMLGRAVKFVDNRHVDDGEDHTYDIRDMVLSQMGEIPDFEPSLIRFYVDILLSDNSA